MATMVSYITETNDITGDALERFAHELGPIAEQSIMTLAEVWQAEGEARGIAKGKAEGRAEGERAMLRRQLLAKFGPLSAATEARLEGAPEGDLIRWAERLLNAKALEDVFG